MKLKTVLSLSCFLSIFLILNCVQQSYIAPELENPQSHTPPPEGLVEVTEVIPTILLDIRYFTTNNFTGEVMTGYEAPRAFLLPEVTAQLAKVQNELLKKGYSLKIYDAYRPMRTERAMIAWAKKTGNEMYLREGYLNTRVTKTIRVGHSCGNSIDLTIVNARGRELDMGTPYDTFSKASWTYNAKGKILSNRLLLKNTMEKYGFLNFTREWWHYNYYHKKGKALDIIIE